MNEWIILRSAVNCARIIIKGMYPAFVFSFVATPITVVLLDHKALRGYMGGHIRL